MNEGQVDQAALKPASQVAAQPSTLGGHAQTVSKEGQIQNFINRLQEQNSQLNEYILMQRDASVKLTGVNPITEQEGSDAPDPMGDLSSLNSAIVNHATLVGKIKELTYHWQTV